MKATTISVAPELVEILKRRGARPDRSHGDLSRSAVAGRMIAAYAYLMDSVELSPPAEMLELVAALFQEPRRLKPHQVAHLPRHVRAAYPSLAATGENDAPHPLVAWLDGLSVLERFALVDLLEQRLAAKPSPLPD